ncbi:MAG: sulfatase [Spirosomataceae bacterium]
MLKHVFHFFLFSYCLCGVAFAQIPQKPNVVFILVDDLGYKDLGYTGSNFYETPHIDQLAKKSARFSKGYAACQVCSPSRGSIMSGLYPTRHGITDYIGAPIGTEWRKQNRNTVLLPPSYQKQLALDYTTIPELLKQNGYATFFAGKWHLGGQGFMPTDQGFDVNKGGNHAGHPASFFSPYKNENLTDGPAGENLEMRLANETVEFIKTHQAQPFFAFLSFYAVHSPIQTTQEKWQYFRDKAEKQGIKETGFAMERLLPARTQQDNPVYAGLVSAMDDAVGKVMKALEALQLDKNTIVVFTSDNGGVVSGDNYSTNLAPLRGGKGYQWEGGLRVPLLISVPWLTAKGAEVKTPVNGIDFLPTLMELTHTSQKPTQKIDGLSLVPLLKGQKLSERPLFWHYPHYGNQGGEPCSIILSGSWKLIHYWEDDRNELYDLGKDITEQTDLAQTNAVTTKALYQQLQRWLKQTNAQLPQKDPEYTLAKRAASQQKVITETWPNQERNRKNMLQKDWKPNETWWGSQPLK